MMIMIRTLIVPGANKIKLQKANFGLLLTQDEGPRGNPSEKPSNKRLEVAQKATVFYFSSLTLMLIVNPIALSTGR
jgi:hypothetical protein